MSLLDTDVVSELRKVSPERQTRMSRAGPGACPPPRSSCPRSRSRNWHSTLLVERRDTAQGRILRTWLDDHVLPTFADRILAIDTVVARRAAALHVPDPRPIRDALIAATALAHGLTVVTRDEDDFAPTGVDVVNPWQRDLPRDG